MPGLLTLAFREKDFEKGGEGGRCWRDLGRNRFYVDILLGDVLERKEILWGRKSVSVLNHLGGPLWVQRKLDFQGY